MVRQILLPALLVLQINAWGQQHNVLKQLIQADSFHVKYAEVLKNPARYHLQVIYTQINRDAHNKPHLKKYFLYPLSNTYYYPASLVKLPLTALALEKIDSLNIPGLTKDTRLEVDSAYYCQTSQYRDTTSKSRYPSIAHYIKKMLLVSDNYSYNRIYEFLSPTYINRRLKQMGYKRAIVNQRFNGGCDSNANRVTNPFTFLDDSAKIIYRQPADSDAAPLDNTAHHTRLGKGFMEGRRIAPPRDFRHNNYIPFQDMNSILLSIIFPKNFQPYQRFHLNDSDYSFLYKYMSMMPRESDYPGYDRKIYKDNFKKYIYYGTTDSISDTASVRSFNIVGRAYGFITDCAYIVDVRHHVEFCLSVLMYVNKRNILNTGDYQYDQIALPFMSDLGHLIYKYERKRKKAHQPDLSKFQFQYP